MPILTLYHKDVKTGMSEIKTASVDLVLTSPPYWSLIDYGHTNQLGFGLTYKHYLMDLKGIMTSCMRVVKEDSFIIIIVGDIRNGQKNRSRPGRPKLYPLHSDIIQLFTEMDFEFFQHHIWRKLGNNKSPGKIVYGSVGSGQYKGLACPRFLYSDLMIEHVLVFRKPGIKRILPSPAERFDDPSNSIPIAEARRWVDPVWEINSPKSPVHPATFPFDLAYRLVKMFSFKQDIILDPFIGSGTTFDVALSLSRNAIGYELVDNYVETICRRLRLRKADLDVYKSS